MCDDIKGGIEISEKNKVKKIEWELNWATSIVASQVRVS